MPITIYKAILSFRIANWQFGPTETSKDPGAPWIPMRGIPR